VKKLRIQYSTLLLIHDGIDTETEVPCTEEVGIRATSPSFNRSVSGPYTGMKLGTRLKAPYVTQHHGMAKAESN
jgi:hypothetical protein